MFHFCIHDPIWHNVIPWDTSKIKKQLKENINSTAPPLRYWASRLTISHKKLEDKIHRIFGIPYNLYQKQTNKFTTTLLHYKWNNWQNTEKFFVNHVKLTHGNSFMFLCVKHKMQVTYETVTRIFNYNCKCDYKIILMNTYVCMQVLHDQKKCTS